MPQWLKSMSFFCKQSGIEKTCIVMEKHGFWVPRISRKMGLGASWYPKIKFQVPNPSQLSKDWIYLNQFIDLNFPAKWKGPMFSFHFSQKNMSWYPYYMNLPSNWFELFFLLSVHARGWCGIGVAFWHFGIMKILKYEIFS